MILDRRSLLTGLAAAFAAPAIVRVASIMPVRALPPDWLAMGETLTLEHVRRFADFLRHQELARRDVMRLAGFDPDLVIVSVPRSTAIELMRRQPVLRLRSIGMDCDAQA